MNINKNPQKEGKYALKKYESSPLNPNKAAQSKSIKIVELRFKDNKWWVKDNENLISFEDYPDPENNLRFFPIDS